MKKLLLILVLVAATIMATAVARQKAEARSVIADGTFDVPGLPEGVLITTNKLEGWEVVGGNIGLMRLAGQTFLVCDSNHTAILRCKAEAKAGERYVQKWRAAKRDNSGMHYFWSDMENFVTWQEQWKGFDFIPPLREIAAGEKFWFDDVKLVKADPEYSPAPMRHLVDSNRFEELFPADKARATITEEQLLAIAIQVAQEEFAKRATNGF